MNLRSDCIAAYTIYNGSLIMYTSNSNSLDMQDIVDECNDILNSLQPINSIIDGPLVKSSRTNTKLPFVLLLGNHSSGKSSFSNFITGRNDIQQTGVAPTDDGFTIICHGDEDCDRNGPAVVNDPEFGFHGLCGFGSSLVHLTKLKIRRNIRNTDFMIVDTPGMIDSPMNATHSVFETESYNQLTSTGNTLRNYTRGYDFTGVCKWYAERADLILLFFDPDKPGTTGETLAVLLSSLLGFDYKLRIILNKADQFHKIHDFARCYGSLCWNLSKVILRKDLPQIFTMCVHNKDTRSKQIIRDFENSETLPLAVKTEIGSGAEAPVAIDSKLISTNNANTSVTQDAITDLLLVRDEVVAEVFTVPLKRIDNELQRLSDGVSTLLMHSKVVQRVWNKYTSYWWQSKMLLIGSGITAFVGALLWYNYCNGDYYKNTVERIALEIESEATDAIKTLTPPKGKVSIVGGGGASVKAVAADLVVCTTTWTEAYQKTVASIFGMLPSNEILLGVHLFGIGVVHTIYYYIQEYKIARKLQSLLTGEAFQDVFNEVYDLHTFNSPHQLNFDSKNQDQDANSLAFADAQQVVTMWQRSVFPHIKRVLVDKQDKIMQLAHPNISNNGEPWSLLHTLYMVLCYPIGLPPKPLVTVDDIRKIETILNCNIVRLRKRVTRHVTDKHCCSTQFPVYVSDSKTPSGIKPYEM